MIEGGTAKVIRPVMLGAFIVALLFLSYQVLHLFLAPVAWAIILVYVTWPVYRRLHAWMPYPTGSALLMTLILGATFALPLLWLIVLLRTDLPAAFQVVAAYIAHGPQPLPDFITRIPWLGPELQMLFDQLAGDRAALNAQLAAWAEPWLGEITAVLGDVGRNAVKFGFALLAAFFLYRDGGGLLKQTRQVLQRFLGERAKAYLAAVGDTIRAVLYGVVLTALAQGLLAGLGYWVAGVGASALLGALTAVVALVPFGPLLVWVPTGVFLLLSGNMWVGIGLLLWGLLVVSQVDNVIRPMVISSATRIPFLLVLFGVLGGISAFGLVGLFLGPVVVAVLLAVWREWLEEQVSHEPSP